MTPLRALAAITIPAAILAAAQVAAAYLPSLPLAAAGMPLYTAVLLATGTILGVAFGRGRVVLAFAVLAAACFALYGAPDVSSSFTGRTLYGAACIAVPVDLGILCALRERGIANGHGARRACALLIQAGAIGLLLSSRQADAASWLYARWFDLAWLARTPLPQLSVALTAASVAGALAAWCRSRSAVDLGLGASAAAFGMAAHGIGRPGHFAIFVAAAALILTVAVLQDGLHMAFRDELTGLASRRALNERLAGLGRRYAIAMVDIDHFKRVNDLYGHDVGDQVLRMVASRLARVRAGCTAYRYGGEEFALVFPGRGADEVLGHLEAVRQAIATYALAVRRGDRPSSGRGARRHRGTARPERSLSVTVSIGVAQRDERHATAAAVIAAADRALYQAKRRGRNAVVR
jgi:GGDEF domain-containing protein